MFKFSFLDILSLLVSFKNYNPSSDRLSILSQNVSYNLEAHPLSQGTIFIKMDHFLVPPILKIGKGQKWNAYDNWQTGVKWQIHAHANFVSIF